MNEWDWYDDQDMSMSLGYSQVYEVVDTLQEVDGYE